MNGPEDFERVEPLPPGQATRLASLLAAVAGVPVSDAERRSLAWLAGFEDATVANIATVIRRARARSASLAARAARDEARSMLARELRVTEHQARTLRVQVDAEACPDCGRGGPHTPVPGQPGTVECRVCSASWRQQPAEGGAR